MITVAELPAERLSELRRLFRGAPIPSLTLPSILSGTEAAALRERVRAADPASYYRADRGRYQVTETLVERELFESLRGLASAIAETPLAVAGSRFTRLAHGDYAMVRDQPGGPFREPHLEALLDLSEAASGEAEIVYTDGERVCSVSQVPGSLALIDRRSPLKRYERYLSCRVGAAEIFRLRLALLPSLK